MAGDVTQQLNTTAAKQREKNRQALHRIILALEFLGRLGLPLRGHRDSGTLLLPPTGTSVIDYTQGNLRATLRLMTACDDKVLREHLLTTGLRTTYISPQAQNELITAMGTVIQNSILDEVKQARFFPFWPTRQQMSLEKSSLQYAYGISAMGLFVSDSSASPRRQI
ncbi:hypothetical protein HOLleu_44585 [Holothuria leucospilota]|uniref:Uncharacterized protein n=1 Tax=Holothuria leucospilota TaxID=206669 RepID=A0A9Q1B9A0_HOLLE|nr:hypothetical protein HOLleu_44585 [Holothuria leucospilota]